MNILRRYLMIVFVSVSLLFGIQVPNFLNQYDQRVDAHLQEVMANIQPYQEIADKYHNGSLDSLINLHKAEHIPTFRDEGAALENMYNRQQRFKAASLAASSGYFWKAIHVVKNGDQELLQETLDKYSYAVPLNQDAVVSGVALAVAVTLFTEMLFGLLGVMGRMLRSAFRKKNRQTPDSLLAKKHNWG
jgi:hypothetical protein